DLIAWMRDRVPGLVLRTTFIVGFPGETEAEFDYLLDSVQRLRFDRVGVFTYSDEDGTAAFSMPERVADSEKRRRRGRLMAAAPRFSVGWRNAACVCWIAWNRRSEPSPRNT